MPITDPPSRPTADVGIRARGLTKRYGSTTAVDDLTFTARPGVITGFLGPNGAGKSTTIRMLLGLARPTSGTITIGDRRITELQDPARTIGTLLDARAVHPHRTAYAHLLAFAQAAGLGRRRVEEVLELVGLSHAATRRVGEFSLGMHQRLGIGTALLGDPRVLVLDEPLNGLDPEGIRWMRTLMRDLAGEGRTILFSSHLMSEMELTADDLVVIGQGRLIAQASLRDFVRDNTSRDVLVRAASTVELARALERAGLAVAAHTGSDTGTGTGAPAGAGTALLVTGADPSAVGRVAATEGIALDELTAVRESLEDVFLRLTHDATDYGSHAA